MSDARAALQAAAQAWHQGRLAQAASLCDQALAQVPEHPGGRNLAGVIAWQLGRYPQALEHLQRALTLEPDNAEFRQNRGLVLLACNRPQDALADLDRVVAWEPANQQALELRAQARAAQDDWAGAMQDYRALLAMDPDSSAAQNGLVSALDRLPLDADDSSVAAQLERCLDFRHVESNLLARPVARYLGKLHGVTGSQWETSIDEVAADPLLNKALNTLYFTDAAMERFLIALRRQLLQGCRAQGRVPAIWQEFIVALARHNLRNEFAHFETPEETGMVEDLGRRIEAAMAQSAPSVQKLSGVVMLYALYRPLDSHACAQTLQSEGLETWPENIRDLINAALFASREEAGYVRDIEALEGELVNASVAVGAMYEDNPYPRWEQLGPIRPGTVAERLVEQIAGIVPPDWAGQEQVPVLIAGCGTGRHALRAAIEYTNAQVLGIDLSRRSLAYAQQKTIELEVANLELLQADLFDLPKLGRRFPLIETIGTLETLDEPLRGWEVLSGLLEPGGFMYVGSYSEVARAPVVAARQRIAELGLAGVPSDMRRFRKAILDGELGAMGERLLRTGDFYSLSGCRDLLFHVREKRFHLRELRDLWARVGLEFLCFNPVPAALRQAYRKRYPDDANGQSLDNWIEFEEQDPEGFGKLMGLSMFYYWLRSLPMLP